MSRSYAALAFTDRVRALQEQHGSGAAYARHVARAQGAGGPGHDPLDDDVRAFLAGRDGFYLATTSETGWPYVQFRGGADGFLRVLDDHTIAWADLRGNLQYVSTGNLAGDDRVSLIVMDYAHRRRLKIFGRARVVTAQEDPALAARLAQDDADGVVERSVVVTVEAYDWNCPQHITPRFTAAELAPHLEALQARIDALETENAALRAGS
ncbi:pyridoxamine 5'-phosphate oxidase family protein [Nocardioides rubriscoriae]|uniref:pyridoxamine 5'-phosphate oxidase family protein n=1 Tax=Nocardioides rubriscoriae TaxID=642762 RepID=UPI0011DF5597|nr:pyridoxamine 5'-phosphate oxidase family protein [Nocardioides rubriscoriae]